MQYYFINESLDLKIIGKYTQSEKAKYNCDVWNEPKFIEHIHQQKIDFEPIVANAILSPKAKLTDLISVVGMGFSRKLLVSGRLKSLIETNSEIGLQFFESPIIHKGDIFRDYWILNVYDISLDKVNYQKSEIFSRRRKVEGGTYLVEEQINNLQEFLSLQAELEKSSVGRLFLNKIYLKEDTNLNFLTLLHVEGGVKYIVSEKLKSEIENAGCTGIEFQPIELTLNEWLAPGGPREQIYGKI